MTMRRSIVWAVALAATLSPLAAQGDKNVRKVEDKGVYFTLPKGWEWMGDNDVIAIKQIIKVKDVEHEITAELVYETKKFADDLLKDIKQKVDDSKGDLRDYKAVKKTKIGTHRAALGSFVRVRGEAPEQTFFEERVYLFKRGDGTFSWIEKNPKVVSGSASSAFEAARKAFSFKDTAETSVSPIREFKVMKGHYKLPDDFEWSDRAEAKSGESDGQGPLLRCYTEVDVKGAEYRCDFQLYIQAPPAGQKYPDQSGIYKDFEANFDPKKVFKVEDVENLKVEKKGDLAGEKAVLVTFTAAFEKNGPKKNFSLFAINKKGNLVQWVEVYPFTKKVDKEVEAALKAARGGLNF
jgi:hypothetical protein